MKLINILKNLTNKQKYVNIYALKEGIMVKEISRTMTNRDGSVDNVIISSLDNYKVKLNKKYVLVGYEGNKYVDRFKNSILGADIGINSSGFASMMIISSLLALAVLLGMYLLFRI